LKDKKATRNAEIDSNASRGVANLTKNLLGNCDELGAIHKYITNVRDIHRSMSMTWSDGGERLVPTLQYPKWLETMTALQDEFYVLVDNFMAVYDWKIMDAQANSVTCSTLMSTQAQVMCEPSLAFSCLMTC
jgi:hypothetical protein